LGVILINLKQYLNYIRHITNYHEIKTLKQIMLAKETIKSSTDINQNLMPMTGSE
jgi:hypothetical protein